VSHSSIGKQVEQTEDDKSRFRMAGKVDYKN